MRRKVWLSLRGLSGGAPKFSAGICTHRTVPPGSLLTSCKPSRLRLICKNVFIFISELLRGLYCPPVQSGKHGHPPLGMVQSLSPHGSASWLFPLPLTYPLLLAQNIRRPRLSVSPLSRQQLRSDTLCLCSMFQPRHPKPCANISSRLHLSLFSPYHGKETVERTRFVEWGKEHLE